jgi:hypothetical protein
MSDGREERKEQEERRRWDEERKDRDNDRDRDWEREGERERRDSRALPWNHLMRRTISIGLRSRWCLGERGAANDCRGRSRERIGMRLRQVWWRDRWRELRSRQAARHRSGEL